MNRMPVRPPPASLVRANGRRGSGWRSAPLAAAMCCACLLAGCSPMRYRLAGEEAGRASAFFAGASVVRYPIVASFSGYAELRGRVLPLVAGVRSEGPSEDIVGIYDSLGRAVFFLENRAGRLTVSRGPAAGEFHPGELSPLLAGPVSIGRIVAGAPGYPVEEGETGKTGQGAWVFRNDRQLLVSDPERRVLARAEYDISGKRITVTYPDRNPAAPPARVEVELPVGRILLRRDAE